jgi:hypothetical protein
MLTSLLVSTSGTGRVADAPTTDREQVVEQVATEVGILFEGQLVEGTPRRWLTGWRAVTSNVSTTYHLRDN